jgi:hypothetical protein
MGKKRATLATERRYLFVSLNLRRLPLSLHQRTLTYAPMQAMRIADEKRTPSDGVDEVV